MRIGAWLSLPLLVWLAPRAAAASAVTLDRSADPISLVERLDALLDPGGKLTVGEVAARELRPIEELDFGVGRWPGQPQPIVWLRFAIDVPAGAASDDWSLIIGRPHDPGTLYVEEEAGHYRAIAFGLDDSGGSLRARLPTAPGRHQVFMRVPGPLTRPSLLHLATPAGQERLLQSQLTAQGLYLGLMVAMLLINLLVGALLRDRAQLWYVGFLATSIATFSLLTGTAGRFLVPMMSAGTQLRLQNAFLALAAVAGIQFSRLFLDTLRLAPRADRVMRGFLVLSAAVVVTACVGPDALSIGAVALLGILVPAVAISAGVSSLRAGSRWARFYLVGWSAFTIGGFLYAVPILSPTLDALQVFQLSSVVEATAFAVALADRLRILRGERAEAERALAQAEANIGRAEKLAALGQLVAGVAHEINNPNNFLTFNLPILQDYLDATRPFVEAADRERGDVRLVGLGVDEFYADATALVGNMKHGAERIAGIVSQLKSYVRQGDETQWEVADVNSVVERAATLVRTQLRQWVHHFELHLADALPRVRMNPARMEQVVINLLLNAGHAAARAKDGRVDVRTQVRDGFVDIAVEDSGPGVPEALRERIFEPFFTTKAGEQGTGMGLAISQRIVDEHGGTLELASTAAGGACFIVHLSSAVEQA